MKRFFSFILLLITLSFVSSIAQAQHNVFIWEKGDRLSVKSADSITVSLGDWLFYISMSEPISISTETFQSSIKVIYANKVKSSLSNPEIGVCISSTNVVPSVVDEHKYLGDEVGKNYDCTFYELDPGTTYYYRVYVRWGNEVCYGNVMSAKTYGVKPTKSTDIIINGHKFVDLGLPSGVLWAKSNLGAAASSDYGDHFAWGEVEPKYKYSWDTYKWGCPPSMYNSSDNKENLEKEDDVVAIKWGNPCRIPSSLDFQELYDKCDWTWQTDYQDKHGYLVTGPNGRTLFLPSSWCEGNGLRSYAGYYWSRSLYTNANWYAYNLCFSRYNIWPRESSSRYCGLPIRPVAKK